MEGSIKEKKLELLPICGYCMEPPEMSLSLFVIQSESCCYHKMVVEEGYVKIR